MIKNILECDFKYEDDKMYRKFKTKWICCNDNKSEKLGYIRISINNKLKHLGYFINEEEANECYKKAYDELMNF